MDISLQKAGEPPDDSKSSSSRLGILCLTALGVVYGDIGTSPLYAMRECFFGAHAVAVSQQNIFGVLSLIFWSLVIVVTLKYHVYVLHADNNGEGGILALMALVNQQKSTRKYQVILLVLGLFGAALLYGDGMITPAISVLSAIEGLEVATPFFKPYVVPITIGILVALFLFQHRGTAGVGVIFGPIIMLWFFTLAGLGVMNIVRHPGVLTAINPIHAIRFFSENGLPGYLVLGAVFLVATGGEALYADLGHFGERAIQIDWFFLVAPALLLNYFGQGALLLSDPEAAHNPFYRMGPSWALFPMVILAAMATVIASQAVISGVFSLTRQAVLLGFAPRVNIIHTSSQEIGQIYIPGANWGLMLSTVLLVLAFKNSSNIAAAYGVAITTTMIITTFLAFFAARYVWKWKLSWALLVTGVFLFIDFSFFGANIVKVAQGGWFPLAIGIAIYLLFSTWKKGRDLLGSKLQQGMLPLWKFLEDVEHTPIHRVEGSAIYLSGNSDFTPIALLHNIKHNKVLHEHNFITTIITPNVPHVPPNQRLQFEKLSCGFYKVVIRYGFMEDPDVPRELKRLKEFGASIDPNAATYIMSRNTLLPSSSPGMPVWRERIFSFLSLNSLNATQFFRLPPNRVVELGMQIEI